MCLTWSQIDTIFGKPPSLSIQTLWLNKDTKWPQSESTDCTHTVLYMTLYFSHCCLWISSFATDMKKRLNHKKTSQTVLKIEVFSFSNLWRRQKHNHLFTEQTTSRLPTWPPHICYHSVCLQLYELLTCLWGFISRKPSPWQICINISSIYNLEAECEYKQEGWGHTVDSFEKVTIGIGSLLSGCPSLFFVPTSC